MSKDRFLFLLKKHNILGPKNQNTKPKIKKKYFTFPKPPEGFKTHYKCYHCSNYSNKIGIRTKYCDDCSYLYSRNGKSRYQFTFNVQDYPDLLDLSLIEKYGWYSTGSPGRPPKNINGVSRDHKVSVNESIKNGYDPYYIKHPCNCELMLHDKNNKKKTKSSLSYEDLILLVDQYDRRSR